jgi:hypothetical protein
MTQRSENPPEHSVRRLSAVILYIRDHRLDECAIRPESQFRKLFLMIQRTYPWPVPLQEHKR